MKYLIIAVSEMRAGVEKTLFDHYHKRLRSLSVTELKQRNCPSTEAIDIEKYILFDDWICVLDERGVSATSRDFS